MADSIQDSILKAMDTLIGNRMSQIATDRTISATVAGCTNALTREYLVNYSGGQLRAYAQEGVTYATGEAVYVLVPEGDFSKTKTIVNKVQAGVEDNENISFVSSALSDYNLIGKNCILDKDKITPCGLYTYRKEDYEVLYQHDPDNINTSDSPKFLSINVEELENNLREAEAVMLEADFRTCMPKAHKISKTGLYGLTFVLAFKDGDKTDEDGNAQTKLLSYTLDSPTMTGSPFNFDTYVSQYQIFPIDVENFLYIDSIVFFSQDFMDKTDDYNARPQPYGWGPDIFVRNVELYGLKKITATNGDYKLQIGMPQGSTFSTTLSSEQLQVTGKVTKQNSNLSDSTTFYWFKEDGRVTSSSSDYQMYGGAGWSWLKSKGVNKSSYLAANENRAYENKYMLVAVYKESVVLKEQFTLYNNAAKRDIEITSTLGTEFSFDRGTPTLTCLIDGKDKDFESDKQNPHPDDYFKFVWSKIDEYGQTLLFNQTYEELEAEYKAGLGNTSYKDLVVIKNKMTQLKDVTWNKNVLTYPVAGIDTSATFKCAVYLRDYDPDNGQDIEDIEYCIGIATLKLKNANAADPTSYYITIENGDQVFQYSESGVSPDDERYTDPLEVKPLTCHFFDPAGLEVNKDTYSLKWKVPLESSLVVVPKEGMVINHSNDKIEYCTTQIFPLSIKGNYDYSALHNQLTAIVTYDGVEYTQDTDLTFTKIGENGTNGTDIVVKVSPVQEPKNNEQLVLEVAENGLATYNNGRTISQQALKLDLYQRNENLAYDSTVRWTILGGNNESTSKFLTVSDGIVTYAAERQTAKFRNQIIKANIKYKVGDTSYDYYGFYPLPIVYYHVDDYKVGIDKYSLLKSITYNADGRNPLYNKNQGVSLTLGDGKYIEWSAEGGIPNKVGNNYQDNPQNAAFKLMADKDNAADASRTLSGVDMKQVYALPDDVYDGAYSNNVIHCSIFNSQEDTNPEVEIYIPIHMSLNNYGLKSLNAWDGTRVEINEDENYIMAPQIGAGEKDENNKFTGLVMGKAQTYDQTDASLGLLGYSHGKQSIFLDAESGKAVFGLPENQASQNNNFEEGRIELVPGGESHIGMWRIGSRALYNIAQSDSADGEFVEVKADKPYNDKYAVKDSQFSVPHDSQGMILGANPAYLSIKGMPLTSKNSKIEWDGANTTIREGDSLEVEIDPRKSSTFSIYRHTKYDDNGKESDEWRRYPLVGINQNGQFYTNAVEDGESSMGIGKIGAFGLTAADGRYVGAQFGWKGTNLFKFFTDTKAVDDSGNEIESDERKTLFLTTGSKVDTEYPRAMKLYGDSVGLYARTTAKETMQTSEHRLTISSSEMFAGHDSSYFYIPNSSNASRPAELNLNNQFDLTTPADRMANFETGQFNIITNGSTLGANGVYINSSKNISASTSEDMSLSVTNNYTLATAAYDISSIKDDKLYEIKFNKAEDEKDNTYLRLDDKGVYNSSSKYTQYSVLSGKKLDLIGTKLGLNIRSLSSAEGIKMSARTDGNSTVNNIDGGGVTLSLIPQDGGNGMFSIQSGCGSIRSDYADVNVNGTTYKRNFIAITPGVATPWLTVTSNFDKDVGGATSISANQDIRSINGWFYGNEFAYNSNRTWNCMGANRTSNKVSDHLGAIYSLLQNLQNQINNEVTNRTNADNGLSGRINTAQTTANNAQSTADKKLDANTFNNHKHTVHYAKSKVSIDGKTSTGEYVTTLGTGFSYATDTSKPA